MGVIRDKEAACVIGTRHTSALPDSLNTACLITETSGLSLVSAEKNTLFLQLSFLALPTHQF